MDDQRDDSREGSRKEYFPPKIVHSEKLTALAAACMYADSATCAPGPIQS